MTPPQAILLINVGTPDTPRTGDVRRYLSQFLGDGRVIDLPWLGRKLLVNGIIVPFRAPKSAKLYQQLWTPNGSPLLHNGILLRDALQHEMQDKADVYLAMRYGNPSIPSILNQINKKRYNRLTIVPLFPHYASSTTGTAIEAVLLHLKNQNVIPRVNIIGQFFQHPAYIEAFAHQISQHTLHDYDHILFSYHGLPIRHVLRTHPGKTCQELNCHQTYTTDNAYCYHAACHATTRLLANKLNLHPEHYTTAFQSRLGKGWLQPFADETIQSLAKKGVKKLLVVSPAFVADCLETTIEIGLEYRELFREHGGENLTLVESLNATPQWVKGLKNIIEAG